MPNVAGLPTNTPPSSTGPVVAYSQAAQVSFDSGVKFYRPQAQGWNGDQIWVASTTLSSNYILPTTNVPYPVNAVSIGLRLQNRLGEVNTNGTTDLSVVQVASSFNNMNGNAAGSFTFSKSSTGLVNGGVFWLDLGSLASTSYSFNYRPYTFVPFDAASTVGTPGAVTLGSSIAPIALPGLTGSSDWEWNSSSTGFVFGWSKPNASNASNKDVTLDFFDLSGRLLSTQSVVNLASAISAWGLGSDFNDSATTGNGYYLFTVDNTSSTVSFAQRYDQTGKPVAGFSPLSFRTLFDVGGIQGWNFVYTNYNSTTSSYQNSEFAISGTRTINGVVKNVIDFYKTDVNLNPQLTQEIVLAGSIVNNRIQVARLPDGKVVFAYQEASSSVSVGDTLHVTQVGSDGLIVEDLTSTLPLGAVFDRLRGLGNGLVEVEFRTPGSVTNSNVINAQIFDTRTALTNTSLSGQYIAGQANINITTSSANAIVIGKPNEVITDSGANGTISYEYSSAGITVDLTRASAQTSNGDASGDQLSGFVNIVGSNYNDSLTGRGASILMGGGGNDTLIGQGTDTAAFRGNKADYTINLVNTTYTVSDTVTGRDGTDTLTNIKYLQFADQKYTLGGSSAAASLSFNSAQSAIGQLNGQYEQIADTGNKTINSNSATEGINLVAGANYTISLKNYNSYGPITLTITDSAGRNVSSTILSSSNNYSVNMTASLSGLYSLKISASPVVSVPGSIISYDMTVTQAMSKLPGVSANTPTGNSGSPEVNALLDGSWWHNPGALAVVDTSASAIIHGAISSTPNGSSAVLSSLLPSSSRQTITYSFLSSAPSGSDGYGFAPMTSSQKTAVVNALNYISSLININFVLGTTAGQADINFGTNNQSADGSAGYANTPYSGGGHPSYLMLANDQASTNDLSMGGYGWETLLHEIGHTLGLKHPGNYNAGGGGASGPYLVSSTDTRRYTIMSYNDVSDGSIAVQSSGNMYIEKTLNPTTFMLYDIEALQYLYGSNKTSSSSSSVFSFSSTYQGFQTIWSPNGGTIDASLETFNNIIDLNPGDYSSIGIQSVPQSIINTNSTAIIGFWTYDGMNNVALSYGSIINVAKGGSGNDIFYLDINNSDTIFGGAGIDTAYLYVKPGDSLSTDYTRTTGSDSNGAYIEYRSTSSLGINLVERLYGVEYVSTYSTTKQIHQSNEITTGTGSVAASIPQSAANFVQLSASLASSSSTLISSNDILDNQMNSFVAASPV